MPTSKESRDTYNLDRFIQAQEVIYADVLSELQSGRKRTHWMWFIFPQVAGLGRSAMADLYAIKSLDEATQYLNHPVLGVRLLECSETVLGVQGRSVEDLFDWPDDLKFRSSMTLFSCVAGKGSIFDEVLQQYFRGEHDTRTLELLGMN